MGGRPERADELLASARAAHRAGRHSEARRVAEHALTLTDDVDLRARLGLTLAYVEAETGQAAAGRLRCRAILDEPGIARVTRGLVWSQLALLSAREGDGTAAFAHFDHAVALLADEPEHLGRALLNRGNLHLQQADPLAAEADLREAVTQLTGAGLAEPAAKATHNLGYARLLAGDLVGALQLMDSAIEQLSPLSPVNESVCQQDRAEVLLAAGRTHESATALRAAATAYSARRLHRFQAECELVLARTLLVEDPAAGAVLARRSARRFSAHGSRGWALRAEALALVGEIERGSRRRDLRSQADEVVTALRREGLRNDADRLALHAVRLAVRRGDLAGAGRRLHGLRIEPGRPVTLRLLSREVRAELAQARGRTTRAREHARLGLGELHEWQSSFGSLDLHTTLVGHGQHLARLGLRLSLDRADPTVVLEWSERARALASRVTTVRPPGDREQARALTELRLVGGEDPERARELRTRIRQRSWHQAEGRVSEPVTMEALVERLQRHEAALVAHIVLDGTVSALVVSPAHQEVVGLGSAEGLRADLDRLGTDLDMAAAHRDGPLADAVRGSLGEGLARVAERLVAPLEGLLGDRRVVLTPSGSLAGTPWSLLPGLLGRPVTVPPSATRWLELTCLPEQTGGGVGLVAGPGLERAVEEVTRAAVHWPDPEVLTGVEATADRVAGLAGRVRLLHLAGHGRHNEDNPLFSGIDLHDGSWFGHDLDLLESVPEVVVLSACELGRAAIRHREESVGMTVAWLHAGARTVLSSGALVADEVACEALADWHRLVAGGKAPADALAELNTESGAVLPFVTYGAGW